MHMLYMYIYICKIYIFIELSILLYIYIYIYIYNTLFIQYIYIYSSGYLGRNIIRDLVKQGEVVHAIGRSEGALKTIRDNGGVAFQGMVRLMFDIYIYNNDILYFYT